jgi:Carboxypeptidase regulatory-like domain
MKQLWFIRFASIFLLAASLAPLQAQAVTGTIHGTVSDTSGARVPGVNVIAVHTATGESRNTSTDEAGEYVFPVLAIGECRVEVEHTGFKKFVRNGVMLNVNSNVRLDVSLEVGQVSEEVRVTADATVVDTRQAADRRSCR